MTKDNVMEIAGKTGKIAVRVISYVSTYMAVVGGGVLGATLLSATCKRAVAQGIVLGLGCFGAMAAGCVVGNLVDEGLQDMGLDVDGF